VNIAAYVLGIFELFSVSMLVIAYGFYSIQCHSWLSS